MGGMAGDAVAARSGRDAARRAASRPKSALRAGGRRPRQIIGPVTALCDFIFSFSTNKDINIK